MTPDEYEHARKLAAQIVRETDPDKFSKLVRELSDFLERIEWQGRPHAKAS